MLVYFLGVLVAVLVSGKSLKSAIPTGAVGRGVVVVVVNGSDDVDVDGPCVGVVALFSSSAPLSSSETEKTSAPDEDTSSHENASAPDERPSEQEKASAPDERSSVGEQYLESLSDI